MNEGPAFSLSLTKVHSLRGTQASVVSTVRSRWRGRIFEILITWAGPLLREEWGRDGKQHRGGHVADPQRVQIYATPMGSLFRRGGFGCEWLKVGGQPAADSTAQKNAREKLLVTRNGHPPDVGPPPRPVRMGSDHPEGTKDVFDHPGWTK